VAQLDAATLVAPIDGIVSAVNITAGADAPSGDAIVVDAGTYDVTADVVETDISKINLDQPATVTIGAISTDVPGTVAAISPSASTSSGTAARQRRVVRGHGHADGPAGRAEVGHDRRHHDHDRVGDERPDRGPRGLNGSSGNYTVRVLGPDGTPQVRPVEVGSSPPLAEITSGLNQGEAVITGTASQRNQTVTNGFGPAADVRRDRRGRRPVPGRRTGELTTASRSSADRVSRRTRWAGSPSTRCATSRLRSGPGVRRDRRAVGPAKHDDEHPAASTGRPPTLRPR
jgi:hypothetical protein